MYLQFFTKSEKRYVFKTVETQNLNGIELKCKQTTCGILFFIDFTSCQLSEELYGVRKLEITRTETGKKKSGTNCASY